MSEGAPEEVKRAVVFIHGFNGSSRGTWTDFLTLVDDHSACSGWWQSCDLFFFHYQWASVFNQLINNAVGVYKFINAVFPDPANVLARGNAYRLPNFRYTHLVLVGHSEGGLLLRKAIVQQAQLDKSLEEFLHASKYTRLPPPKATGMLCASMRLFAPALGGEMQSGLLGVLTSLPVVNNFLAASAARKGMNPAAAFVTEARRQTDELAEYLPFECFRAHILWAEKDVIISGEKYKGDLQCLTFPTDSSHTSVCKPTLNYSLPLDFVELGVGHHECL